MRYQYISENTELFDNMNPSKYADIEVAFSHLRSNPTNVDALRKISDALSDLTGKTITVKTVSPRAVNQECYVMSVYPDESTLDIVVNAIVNQQSDQIINQLWKNTVKWTIEVDTRILAKNIGLTDKELTALILHEVGHVMFSDRIPTKLSKVVKFELAKTKLTTKSILQDNVFSKILYFPILGICNMTRNRSELNKEIAADNYSVKAGYGEDLHTAITKITSFTKELNTTDKDAAELTGFSIDMVDQLKNRQNHIARKNLEHMIIAIPSEYAREAVSKVSTLFHGNTATSMNEAAKDAFLYKRVDNIVESTKESYMYEGIFNRVHKLKKIDPADLDYIQLEINNIKSNDDKMMVISYIYSKLDIVNYYIDILDSGTTKYYVPHSKNALLQMKDTLEKAREIALNKKLPEIEYGINIQFPEGYRG